LKIAAIEVYPFEIPMKKEIQVAVTYGLLSGANNIAVRVVADEGGLYGWGEASCSVSMFFFNGESQASVRAALRVIAPQLLGEDPMNVNAIQERLSLIPRNQAKCAIDMALHDLIGKSLGVPVYQLLGGAHSMASPMSYTIGIAKPESMAADALRRVEEGYRTIEVKVGKYGGRVSIEDDVARVKAVRDAIGNDVVLIVDANIGWSIRQALNVIKRIEGLDVLVEQPHRTLEGLREIHKRTSVPIIADESCQGIQDTVRIIENDAADIASVKLAKFSGFRESMKIISMCEAFGLDYRYDNMTQTRLAATASVHLTFANSNGIPSGGTAFTKYEKDLVKEGGIVLNRGTAYLKDPGAPGLGLTVDESILMEPDVYQL